jgi:hypothetical protein
MSTVKTESAGLGVSNWLQAGSFTDFAHSFSALLHSTRGTLAVRPRAESIIHVADTPSFFFLNCVQQGGAAAGKAPAATEAAQEADDDDDEFDWNSIL